MNKKDPVKKPGNADNVEKHNRARKCLSGPAPYESMSSISTPLRDKIHSISSYKNQSSYF